MAYNSVSVGNLSAVNKYLYKIKALSGGITFDDDGEDNYVCEMSNMYFENGNFSSRGAFCQKGNSVAGEYKSAFCEEYYGNIIFHAGTSLYRFDGETIYTLINGVGEKGFFVRMNAKVYFYSVDEKIFETDRDFNCKAVEPYYPIIIKDASKSLSSYNTFEPLNMLTSRVRCRYTLSSSEISTNLSFVLPYPLDETKSYFISCGSAKPTIIGRSYDAQTKKLSLSLKSTVLLSTTVDLEYSIDNSNKTIKENLDKIYGSKIAFCYGGTTKDGSRAFVTGNPDYPSMYFRSELKNPLFFPDTNQEILGDGSENVNGAEKRYEKMYFFTDKHIYAMNYSFSETDGADFTISSINTGVGCNMPGSVRALDNTIVFADKTDGVFIMQSTDIFAELNIMPISGNLRGDTGIPFGKDGKYFSCDYDRKYYICNGKGIYMWDYGRVPFYSGTEYRTSQKKLPWFKICDADDIADIFVLKGKLYFAKSNDKCGVFEYSREDYWDETNSDGVILKEDFVCSFTTKKYDFGNPYTNKRLLKFSFNYENESQRERIITCSFYSGGKNFYTTKAVLSGKEGRMTVKIPSYYGNKFSVRVEINGGGVGFRDLGFLWQKAERVKFYD